MHDLGLDADTRRLEVELEDLVQGGEVAQIDALMQALKLGTQVVGRVRVDVVATEQFVDQADDAQARIDVGDVGVILDNANGQPGLADRQVGLLPCERVVNLGEEYDLDCHLPVLIGDL